MSDPEVPESEPTPTEEGGETLCKLVLERLPYDLSVIDAGNDPDALRTNGTPMFLRPKGDRDSERTRRPRRPKRVAP